MKIESSVDLNEEQCRQPNQERSLFEEKKCENQQRRFRIFNRFCEIVWFNRSTTTRQRIVRLGMLGAVCGLTFLFSAIQILPSAEMTAQSERRLLKKPLSLWDVPCSILDESPSTQSLSRDENSRRIFHHLRDGLFCQNLDEGGHPRAIYQYSLGPWRWLEMFFPNVAGKQFPVHARWMSALPNEINVWTPSLYMGIFTILLALASCRFRGQCRGVPQDVNRLKNACGNAKEDRSFFKKIVLAFNKDNRKFNNNSLKRVKTDSALLSLPDRKDVNLTVWATWLTLLTLLASLGGFGLLWMIRAAGALLGNQENLTLTNGDPVGGVYWLGNLLIPFFSSFRYPAKLFLFVTFGITFLAGQGLASQRFQTRRFRNAAWFLLIISLLVGGFLCAHTPDEIFLPWANTPSLFGPFQAREAYRNVFQSMTQTALLIGIFLGLFRMIPKDTPRFWNVFFLLALVLDLFLANRGLLQTIPQTLLDQKPVLAELFQQDASTSTTSLAQNTHFSSLQSDESQPFAKIPLRIFRSSPWYPNSFYTTPSPTRTAEKTVWENRSLFPKTPYLSNIAVVNVRGTMMPAPFFLFSHWLRTHENIGATLAFLDVQYLVFPRETPDMNRWKHRGGQPQDHVFSNENHETKNGQDSSKKVFSPEDSRKNNFREKDSPEFVAGLRLNREIDRLTIAEKSSPLINAPWLGSLGPDAISSLPKDVAVYRINVPTSRVKIFPRVSSQDRLFEESIEKPLQKPLVSSQETLPPTSKIPDIATIVQYAPNRLTLHVHLNQESDLVLAEQYWKGWNAYLMSWSSSSHALTPCSTLTVLPYKKLLRRVTVPPGDWQIVFHYEPLLFSIGLWISAGTLLLFFGGMFVKKKNARTLRRSCPSVPPSTSLCPPFFRSKRHDIAHPKKIR